MCISYDIKVKQFNRSKNVALTGKVHNVVVELVGKQRFWQLPQKSLKNNSSQVDIFYVSEIHWCT